MRDHEHYAHAFYQLMGDNQVNYYLEFQTIAEVIEHYPQLQSKLIFKPDVLEDIHDLLFLGTSDLVKRMVTLLLDDGMIDQISYVKRSIRDLLIKNGLWTWCRIETAQLMSSQYYDDIQSRVKKMYTSHIEFESRVNPMLLGGIRLLVNDSVIDLSIEGRLKRLIDEVSYG